LADDERFATGAARREHRDVVDETLGEAFADATADEWFDRLRERGVPAAPIYDTLDVRTDEHVGSRDLLTTVTDGHREVDAIRHPVAFDSTDQQIERGVPALGETTAAALSAVGVDDAQIDAILAAIDPPDP
jgi:formyl-CoA transferase